MQANKPQPTPLKNVWNKNDQPTKLSDEKKPILTSTHQSDFIKKDEISKADDTKISNAEKETSTKVLDNKIDQNTSDNKVNISQRDSDIKVSDKSSEDIVQDVVPEIDNSTKKEVAVLINNDTSIAIKNINNVVAVKDSNTQIVEVKDTDIDRLYDVSKHSNTSDVIVDKDESEKKESSDVIVDTTANLNKDFSLPVFKTPNPVQPVQSVNENAPESNDVNKIKIEYKKSYLNYILLFNYNIYLNLFRSMES